MRKMNSLAGKATIFNIFLFRVVYILHHRCLDELFLTWNESVDKLYDILNTINRQYPHLRMTITMGNDINYLDANIRHIYGDLKTKVAKNVDTAPYSIPYVFGHRQGDHSTLFRAAMIRAIRCCSDLFEFMNEYDDIQFSFRHNGFSHDMIVHNIQLFLTEFDAEELKLDEDEASYNPYFYDNLREHVLKYIQQRKLAKIERYKQNLKCYRNRSSDHHRQFKVKTCAIAQLVRGKIIGPHPSSLCFQSFLFMLI